MLTSLEVTKNADTVEAATAALKEATSKEAVPRLTQPKVEAILINRLRLLDGLPSAEAIMRQLNAGGASMSLVNNIISALASFFTYHRASDYQMSRGADWCDGQCVRRRPPPGVIFGFGGFSSKLSFTLSGVC